MSGSNKGIHTVWHENENAWANVEEGREQPLSKHSTKEEAVEKGRQLAKSKSVEHLIHNKEDLAIHARNSYGNDPRNVPG
jgi:hypothetical protein